jgi:glycosyltransferase involved in cell wall biosynthesis
MAKIEVVTLVDRIFGGGGGERVAASVAARLDPTIFTRTLCVSRPSAPKMVEQLREAGVKVLELDRQGASELLAWRPLLQYLRGAKVDILHTHKFGSNVWGAVTARIASTPVLITHEHSWSFSEDTRRRLLDRYLIAPRASAMIAVSAADARRMNEIEGIPIRKIRVIPNGIDLVHPANRLKLRGELELPAGTPIIGFVGSLRPEKRVDLIIDASSRLAATGMTFHVALVGDGPERKALQERVIASGLEANISFLGYRDDATELASGFDIGVLASDREGAPLALLEYMGLGLAIVATRVGGIPDIVDDKEHALLVEPDDVSGLEAALQRLLTAPSERARLGAAAAARQADEFDLSVVTRRIERLYLELLGRATP